MVESQNKKQGIERWRKIMMNFRNDKSKKMISTVIIIVIVLAMVVPTILAALV